MPIRLVPIGKTRPEDGATGKKKYYAQVVSSGTDTIDDIIRRIEKKSTVSGADIQAVLYDLVEEMKSSFSLGRIVQLDRLGNFRLSVSSEGVEEPEKAGARQVRQVRVIFKPDKELKRWLKTLKFTRQNI